MSDQINFQNALPVDFSKIEAKLGEICKRADARLCDLCSENGLKKYALAHDDGSTTSSDAPPLRLEEACYELRLGTVRLDPVEIASKRIGEIVPLDDSHGETIQLWIGDQTRAEGTLLVVNGKLAMKINRVFAEYSLK